MKTEKTPPENVKKDNLPLSWVLVGIGLLLAIVLMIVVVVSKTTTPVRYIHTPKRSAQ